MKMMRIVAVALVGIVMEGEGLRSKQLSESCYVTADWVTYTAKLFNSTSDKITITRAMFGGHTVAPGKEGSVSWEGSRTCSGESFREIEITMNDQKINPLITSGNNYRIFIDKKGKLKIQRLKTKQR